MDNKAVVSVYGYSKNVPAGYRPWQDVSSDRLQRASDLLGFLDRHGIEASLFISGGTVDPKTGETEARSMLDLMRSKVKPGLEDIVSEVVLDEQAKNTSENMQNIASHAKKVGAKIVLGVTSTDHVSRAAKEGAYNPAFKDTLFGVVPSAAPYSTNGSSFGPMVLEPPFFPDHETYRAFGGVFRLTPEQKRAVAQVITGYQSKT